MSIRYKLIIMFLAIALIPLLFVSVLTFHNYKNSLEAGRLSQMQDLAAFKADKIETYFAGLKAQMEIAQGFYNIKKNLPVLARLAHDPNNPEFLAAKKMLDEQLQQMQSVSGSGLSDIMLVNPEGRVVYANRPGHYSKDLSKGYDAEQKAFSRGKDRICFSDVYFDKEEDNRLEMLLTAPASDFNGAFIGVIAFEVDMTPVHKLIQDATGLGKTGEVLVGKKTGEEVVYLNPLRHEPNTVMKRINIGGEAGGPVQEAVQGRSGAGQLIDYRGKKVIAAWRYIPFLDWGMVAKIDAKEAFADVTNLRNLIAIILIVIIVLSGIMAFSITQSISEPIKRLSKGAEIIGSGNLDYKIGTNLKDEIGQLSRSFDKMTHDLKATLASRDELRIEVHERKQAEEALRESEIKHRTVADNTYDWEFWLGPEGRFIYCSPSCERITGHKYKEFLADPELRIRIIHPDDRPRFENHQHEVEGKRMVGKGEWRLVRPDGTWCWVAHVCQSVFSDEGEYLGVRGSNRDITERKQMEEELLKSRDELELRVEERTAELSRSNKELSAEIAERKRMEEELRTASIYARSLIEASLDPLVTISADGKITDVNEATVKVTGVPRDQLIGTDFSNYFTEPQKAREGYQQVFADGFVTDYPLTIRHHGGRLTDVLYNASVYKDTRGNVLGVFAAARDVTVQKQASQYARSLIESSLDPLVTISADGKITDVNEATELVTGLSRERLIGSDFSDYFTEPQKANEGYKKVISEGLVRDYPLTIRHRDGRLTDVLYNASIYKDTRGSVLGVFAAARDVTERKLVERRQKVTNALLGLFAQKASRKEYLDSVVKVIRNWSGCNCVGIRIKDNEGNIPYQSYVGFEQDFLALEDALRLDRDKCLCIRAILQQPQEQDKVLLTSGGSFYCNDSPAFLKGLSEKQKKEYRGNCIKHGFQSIAVVPIRYRDEIMGAIHLADSQKDMVPLSKIQFIETTVSPLIGEAIHRFNAESELEEHRLHLEDLVKQRTDELVRSNKDLEQFAYVASHDLQEPLRIIAGYTQLLQQRYKDKLDEDANQFISFTVESTVRMQNLINDLLSYSRLETRGGAFEPADCQAILNDVLRTLRMAAEESGAVITHGPLPTVRADRAQLFQLFQNLIVNAIKFRSDEPPRIHIAAEPQNGRWLFSVKDNGIGIDPKYSERIFVIFQRLHTRDKYPGTGIGLAICKKIVERHGGRIWVESQPGKGATFYFLI